MSNEMQFLLYNMPDAEGKVQVVIKEQPPAAVHLRLGGALGWDPQRNAETERVRQYLSWKRAAVREYPAAAVLFS